MSKQEAEHNLKYHVKDLKLKGNKQPDIKQLIAELSTKHGMSPIDIERIVDHQYKVIKDSISTTTLSEVDKFKNFRIKYIGVFYINKSTLKLAMLKNLLLGHLSIEIIKDKEVLSIYNRFKSLIEGGKLTAQKAIQLVGLNDNKLSDYE